MHKNQIYTDLTTLQGSTDLLQAENFLDGLQLIDFFNFKIIPFVNHLENILKRSVRIVGGFLSQRIALNNDVAITPPEFLNYIRHQMSCIIVVLKQNELQLVPQAQFIVGEYYSIPV